MNNRTAIRLAASTLIVSVPLAGCVSDGAQLRSASRNGTALEQGAGKSADAALTAARSGNWIDAVTKGEAAVAGSPRDAGFRRMLGDLYLKAGRFASAASAYGDTLALNPGDGKAALSRALSQIALGRNADALATLSASGAYMAAADHGLALALAGDRQNAIRVLSDAAREIGASGRVRQNLALSYALAGDWTQSRAIAAQDVPPQDLDARMESWAEFASPRATTDQVATLLGVTPVLDPGQPTRLALIAEPSAPVRIGAMQAGSVQSGSAQAASVEPMPASAETFAIFEPVLVAEAAAPPQETPVLAAAIASVESALPAAISAPIARTMRAAASAPASFRGRYVVQLGAFASDGRVEQAWNGAVGRLDRLANYIPASTRFSAGDGTRLTRLSVGGFASRVAARNLCESLKRAGGACFVRAAAGDVPVRWASRTSRYG